MKAQIAVLGLLVLPLMAGCLLRGDIVLAVNDPRAAAWTPGRLLVTAIETGGGDPNNTLLLEYGAVFDEDRHLRVLELRVLTTPPGGGEDHYLDFLVGTDYDPEADEVRFTGFRHEELDSGQRQDPSKEFRLDPFLLDRLDAITFAEAAAPSDWLVAGPHVLEWRLTPDCAPHHDPVDGFLRIANVTDEGLGPTTNASYTMPCFVRPQLPAAALVNLHVPCRQGPGCPEAEIVQHVVNYANETV